MIFPIGDTVNCRHVNTSNLHLLCPIAWLHTHTHTLPAVCLFPQSHQWSMNFKAITLINSHLSFSISSQIILSFFQLIHRFLFSQHFSLSFLFNSLFKHQILQYNDTTLTYVCLSSLVSALTTVPMYAPPTTRVFSN